MRSKTSKFFLKTVLFFPIGFLIWSLQNGFEITRWILTIITGFVISFEIVFWQLFEYKKHNDLSYIDFLESKHSIRIENSAENWKEINQMIRNPFAKLKIIEKNESSMRIQINNKLIDSILTIKKTGTNIKMEIRKKSLDFLLVNAQNYRRRKKLASSVKTNGNNV
ncbi:hypothetical protein [Patiriisocius sp. Uisw_017]|jgi:Fe-S cluster assembly scaffold protein SufB|uniref:hypothetical protein n=1 Tax=Patiriisocius sp. Uisw_017 TaxID=3230968 RepID=UPI0039EA2D46